MLQSLTLRNIALIESLNIQFHHGFQALTGETGAGKSIVVDAVNLALGGRADRDLIRTGTEKASVEAVFDIPNHPEIARLLQQESIEFDGRTVTVYREISGSGKNLCRICGVLMPVSFLRDLAEHLMDVHGQHDHRFLMDPRMHLEFLDQMGDEAFQQQRAEVREAFLAFIDIHRSYARMNKKNENREVRITYLEKELRLLHAARLKPGEEEQLREEMLKLQGAEKIADALRETYTLLTEGDLENGALVRIHEAAARLHGAEKLDTSIEDLHTQLENAYFALEDIAFELQRRLEKAAADPGRLEKIGKRLELIARVKAQYGNELSDVQRATGKLEEEYEELCGLEDTLRKMAAAHKQALSVYRKAARKLTEMRHQLASRFEKQMELELHELGMPSAVFQVHFAVKPDEKPLMPRESGDDEIEFMLTPNPGEPLKPLARTASGGELSRILLALKTLEAGNSGVDAMVFDEIDTGISGRMAQVVAEKMHLISRTRQVICVTHLPQIAAAADFEYSVRKEVIGERTYTVVVELNEEGRVEEVARMISGAQGVSQEALQYARNMLNGAQKNSEKVSNS